MQNARDDLLAIEAATDLLTRGLNRADISSVTDLVTDTTLVLPPGRRTARGQAAVECWRNVALGNEGIRMMSTDMDTLGEGLVRDVGTLSMRLKQDGERTMFRYMMIWQKIEGAWTVATMTWNREPTQGGRRRGQGGGDQGGGDQGGGQGEM